MSYDVAVVGLGGMGSAILAHCAGRGASVIGIEQFSPAHDLGSSHGKSRMIRKAYFEDPDYVPLVLRAYELWRELERETGEAIMRTTGVLTVGEEDCAIVEGTRHAAERHGLPLECLSRGQVAARYPMLRVRSDEIALFEPDGGVLNPERAVRAHLQQAEAREAHARFGQALASWAPGTNGFVLSLDDGMEIRARALVLALGPWFKQTLEGLGIPIRVQRNVQAWFSPTNESYRATAFPSFLLDRRGLPAPLYGFPDFGDGLKAAFHGFGDLTDAEHLNREIDLKTDIAPLVRALEAWIPGASAELRAATPCMYTLTPDEHFVVDIHPEHPGLVLCGGFSGHGFKFAPVIGEIGADLALNGGSGHRIEFLSLRRFLP